MTLSSLLAITDFFFLGRINNEYYSIVGLASIPFSLLSSLLVGFGIEVNRQISSGSQFDVLKVVRVAISFSFILIFLFNMLGEELFFYVQNVPIDKVKEYFFYMSLSALPLSVIFIGAGFLRGQGHAIQQIPFSITAVFLNAILDFIFIENIKSISPLAGCAIATVIADSVVSFLYLFYLVRKRKEEDIGKWPSHFIKNTALASLDKLFSVASLVTVSHLFVGFLPSIEAALYFSSQTYLMPLVLWSHAYFEWILQRKSKNLDFQKRNFSLLTISFFALTVFFVKFFSASAFKNLNLFFFLYFLYLLFFCKEREYYAILFSAKQGHVALAIATCQKIILFVLLLAFCFLHQLTLILFMTCLLFTMGIQNFFLRQKSHL